MRDSACHNQDLEQPSKWMLSEKKPSKRKTRIWAASDSSKAILKIQRQEKCLRNVDGNLFPVKLPIKIKQVFFFSLKRFKSLKFTSCAPFLKKQPDNIFQPNKRLNKPNRRQKGNQYKQVAGRGGKGGGGAGDPLYEEGRSFRIVTVHKSLDQSKENDSSEVSSPHSNSSTRKRQN